LKDADGSVRALISQLSAVFIALAAQTLVPIGAPLEMFFFFVYIVSVPLSAVAFDHGELFAYLHYTFSERRHVAR